MSSDIVLKHIAGWIVSVPARDLSLEDVDRTPYTVDELADTDAYEPVDDTSDVSNEED